MHTFEETTKEGSIDSNADDSKKNTAKKDATNDQISTDPLNVEIASTEARSNLPNNLREDNFARTVNDNLKNAESNVNISNISTKQSADVPLANTKISDKTSNNIAEKQPPQNKPFSQLETEKLSDYAITQILQEPKIELLLSMNDSGTMDPLELPSEFNCSDEFVNTNLLDNAEFLKNFTPDSDNTFSKFADKTEDSDVEILESEERVAARKNVEDDVKKKAEPEAKTENEEQVALSDTTEMKCTSGEASAHITNATVQPDKPLTLDDIKDTGRIGLELYKCGYLECSFAAPNAVSLKIHIKTCNLGDPTKNLFCPHCKKRFVKIGLLLEHMKTHGLKRFGCSMCKLRYSVSYQATAHMKQKHKFFNTKLVPADPTNPSVDGLFIVQAIVSLSQ